MVNHTCKDLPSNVQIYFNPEPDYGWMLSDDHNDDNYFTNVKFCLYCGQELKTPLNEFNCEECWNWAPYSKDGNMGGCESQLLKNVPADAGYYCPHHNPRFIAEGEEEGL